MELVIFTGLPGSGKSVFYAENFLHSHLRISLDQLKTRNKEDKLLGFCIEYGQKTVIDNTNVLKKERARYIQKAQKKNFTVCGYYFNVPVDLCLKRNKERTGKYRIDERGIFVKNSQMELPDFSEGFDEIFEVGEDFSLKKWFR